MSNSSATEQHILFVDSRHATRTAASVARGYLEYTVLLNGCDAPPGIVYRDVKSIELASCSFTNSGTLFTVGETEQAEHYFIMDIRELNGRVRSNVPGANMAFSTMYCDPSRPTSTQVVKGQYCDTKTRVFDPPLGSLPRLTIRIMSPSPATAPVNSEGYAGYFTFLFKLVTLKNPEKP